VQTGPKAIDLLIPVLLKSETIWWKKDGGLPIYATDADNESSDSDYFLPASWTVDQTKFVLENFSGILIQVKNHKQPRRGDVKKCHDKIQKMANQIFETGSMNKPCVSLYMQLGGKRPFKGMNQVEMCSGTLRVSLITSWRSRLPSLRAMVTHFRNPLRPSSLSSFFLVFSPSHSKTRQLLSQQ
jgi:hypothetical protein